MDGQLVTSPPLEQLEHCTIEGLELESFNTSGGLGTLAETLKGQVKSLDYKTLRFPGHRDIIKLLRGGPSRNAACNLALEEPPAFA